MNETRRLKRSITSLLFVLAMTAAVPCVCGAASEEANIYFNAGMEKYLQGAFIESVENLEKAQKLDPANPKIKELMVKILLEAATQNHLNRNYRQAMVFMKKAYDIAPENPKVQEMYHLTQELMTPPPEKTVSREKRSEPKPVAEAAADAARPSAEREPAAAAKREMPQRQPQRPAAAAARQATVPAERGVIPYISRLNAKVLIILLVWLLASPVVLFLAVFILYMKARELSAARLELARLDEESKRLSKERATFQVELEKAREAVKYEHHIAESALKELKDLSKREGDRIRLELDTRTREMEEKVRTEMAQKYRAGAARNDDFLQREQENFMRYSEPESSGAGPGEETSAGLESTRERIAVMAQNLYEYAPGAAMEFLEKMARNDNPLVRSNVVQALTLIAKPETLEILFRLYQDSDPRVKRESLKRMKQLMQKVNAAVIELAEPIRHRLGNLIDEEKSKGEWIF